ncbi:hypothetical protein [Sansalvadorimonas verongulae]|uniref:hypothetical protein n=1 Tax=Sansalvadorimonas verongulae TaxID=2172824 RepID=UPI0012BBD575|nr:hypothetical protein [Sansalvadorimonas verongulae]MTI12397.1 hypothetical protein [Sansalvadorimonas verongulae]
MSERVTTYEPCGPDALVDQGVDGEYVRTEHFDRAVTALAWISAASEGKNMSAEQRLGLINEVLNFNRGFINDNCMMKLDMESIKKEKIN